MGATLRTREKRRMVEPIMAACSLVTEITTEVAVFRARVAGFGWRKRADAIVMLEAKWTADFIVSSRSFGSEGMAKSGMPCMAISELLGAGLKSLRGCGSRQ